MSQTQTGGRTATSVTRHDDILRVTYHDTDVVTVYPNGRIDLDTGGWFTATTKLRMNQASNQFGLGFVVYQRNYQWFVDVDGHTLAFESADGMRVNQYLTIRNGHD